MAELGLERSGPQVPQQQGVELETGPQVPQLAEPPLASSTPRSTDGPCETSGQKSGGSFSPQWPNRHEIQGRGESCKEGSAYDGQLLAQGARQGQGLEGDDPPAPPKQTDQVAETERPTAGQ